jgi:hypothetical protein
VRRREKRSRPGEVVRARSTDQRRADFARDLLEIIDPNLSVIDLAAFGYAPLDAQWEQRQWLDRIAAIDDAPDRLAVYRKEVSGVHRALVRRDRELAAHFAELAAGALERATQAVDRPGPGRTADPGVGPS